MGVFKIENLKNGKIFIGSSPNLDVKWNSQKMQLETNTHPNAELQKDWNELGESNFAYGIIDTLNIKDFDPKKNYTKDIRELETMYLEELQPFGEKGYNKIRNNY